MWTNGVKLHNHKMSNNYDVENNPNYMNISSNYCVWMHNIQTN
jgi:hypothetical protein